MTRSYKTLSEITPELIQRSAESQADPANLSGGLMGTRSVSSRFADRQSAPIATRQAPEQNQEQGISEIQRYLGQVVDQMLNNSDDPEAVRDAISTSGTSTPPRGQSSNSFDTLPPVNELLNGDQTREALGEPDPVNVEGSTRGPVPVSQQQGDTDIDVQLFDTIVSGESEDYNTVYSGSQVQPPKPLTEMTVSEVRAWQDRSVAAGSDSSAAGRFQIIRKTMDSLIEEGVLSPDDTFNEETQNRAYEALLERRGFSTFKSRMQQAQSEEERRQIAEDFQMELAKEFASVPVPRDVEDRGLSRGDSYYEGQAGNRALHSADDFLQMLMRF